MFTVPAATPVTTPDVLTVAMVLSPLLHTPPEAVSASVVTEPMQTVGEPVITPALGNGEIVTIAVAAAGAQPPMIA
jgi:hypothetical protein